MNTKALAAAPRDFAARVAVAQFLLFDATLESLSLLGERITRRSRAAPDDAAVSAAALAEPFRVRFAYLRRAL